MDPEKYARALREVVKYSAADSLPLLLKSARENPEDINTHGAIADALDETHPGNKIADLIREQFGLGVHAGKGPKGSLYQEPFYNSHDTDHHLFHAPIGSDGPFKLFLGHDGPVDFDGEDYHTGWEHASGGGQREHNPHPQGFSHEEWNRGWREYWDRKPESRWYVRAMSKFPATADCGYTFEFPHDQAHLIPNLFPKALDHINPAHPDKLGDFHREREGRDFEMKMRDQEENRE